MSMMVSNSAEQINCPVVIEVFWKCQGNRKLEGARVGRSFWSGSRDQQGLFWAPPCGTCSLVRNIQLRDSMRSSAFPEGLPFDKQRSGQSVGSEQAL